MIDPMRKLSVVILLSLLAALTLGAQSPSTEFAPATTIPFDSVVRTGTLGNGFRYYIRENGRPANRIALRLAVKAGSVDEADDQQGLAHFIEHMAFNGSAHFKPGQLVSYFESTGARLGPHVNAYTSFDETVYQLELPTDRPDIVAKGFSALGDFAGGLTFEPAEVEKERGVVIEEWRNGLGSGSRIRDRQIPVLFYRSRYAQRIPIGKPDIIRTAPAERLRAFYDTWYRPDVMALVAVGHVDPKQIEGAIRTTFGSLKPRAPRQTPPDTTVSRHSELLSSATADPEVTSSSVQLMRQRPREGESLVGDYRRDLAGRLFERMLNQRFDELSRKPDARFLSAAGGDSPVGRTVNGFSLSARVKDGGILDGLQAIELEARRARDFGFTASEFDLARRATLSFYQRAYDERDKTESAQFANEYVRNFLVGEPSPGIEYEFRLVRRVLNDITIDEITAVGRARLNDDSRVVLAVSPQKPGLALPDEAELRTTLSTADSAAVTPPNWNDAVVPAELMLARPTPAAVVSKRELPKLGITVVRFANGVEAWLKPTDFKNDQVIFLLSAPGGASLASDTDFTNATMAPGYIRLSGFGGLKALDIQKMTTGTSAAVFPSMSPAMQSISGSASPGGIETALQLMYLQFTAPGDDPDAFVLLKRQLEAAIANRGQNPAQVFAERVGLVNSSNHFTAQPLTTEKLATLDREKMLAFYRARFSNAADFTFFMVGSFNLDEVIPLLAQYVGTLPSTGSPASKVADLGIHFPATIQRVQIERGREPRAQTVISFFADPPQDQPAEHERISAATMVLQLVLRDVLRESLGQTYGVSVSLAQAASQRDTGHIRVVFAGAPENMPSMTERVMQEVKKLQEQPPPAALIATVKETARRQNETNLKENGFWLAQLQSLHTLGLDPSEIASRPARIDAISAAGVQDAFRKYFPMDRYTVVTLVPEKQP
jgi:zinc protease